MSAIFIGAGAAVLAVGLTGYSMYKQHQAAGAAAQVDQATAAHNAKVDEAMADQLDLDTIENIRTQRREGKAFLSREEASYAAAGVIATSGSPMHAMITSAGRMEKEVQQQYQDSQIQQAKYRADARIGRLSGEARATSDRAAGTIALLNGGASIASQIYGGYKSGAFKGPTGGATMASTATAGVPA